MGSWALRALRYRTRLPTLARGRSQGFDASTVARRPHREYCLLWANRQAVAQETRTHPTLHTTVSGTGSGSISRTTIEPVLADCGHGRHTVIDANGRWRNRSRGTCAIRERGIRRRALLVNRNVCRD